MKRVGLIVVSCLAVVLSADGQLPALPGTAGAAGAASKSVYLDVVESTGSAKTVDHWRDVSGAYSQSRTSSKALAITVRNMSQLPGEFEIEWYFFGKPASGTGRFLYDKGSKKVTLGPNAYEKVAVDSKELTKNTTRDYFYYGYNYTTGDKADGWIIRAKAGDDVVRVKASSAVLEQLTQDQEAFERLTKDTKGGGKKKGKD